jgi:predicted nucleic acid-binding protein
VSSFVDANVLVGACDRDEPVERRRAFDLLQRLAAADELVLSTQGLQELYVTATRKLARPLPEADAVEAEPGRSFSRCSSTARS